MQFSLKRNLWRGGGQREDKILPLSGHCKLKEKEIKDAHTLLYTQQSFLTKLCEHLW
jgi:hypothetical protein